MLLDEVLLHGQRCTVVHRAGVRAAVVRDPSGALRVLVRAEGAWALDGAPYRPNALLSAIGRASTLASG